VTAKEPPNPYAPSDALNHDVAAEVKAKAQRPRTPSRLLAVVTTLFAFPFLGAGFVILGRRRRFHAWVTAGALLFVTAIVAARLPVPRLCVAAFAGAYLAALLAVIHTAATTPTDGLTGTRAWLVALGLILGAKAIGLVVKHTLVEAFQIPSGSMMPTLRVDDQMFVKKGRAGIGRGDVVVFRAPPDPDHEYIKRVMAIGGDTIAIRQGIVSVNGLPLEQIELESDCEVPESPGCVLAREANAGHAYAVMFTGHTAADLPSTVVPPDHVFVVGDNRDNSHDSRAWGSLPVDHIKGVVTLTYWSNDPKSGIRWSRVGRGVE
jgi:signal peptidase I